jgi:hypothetical protein
MDVNNTYSTQAHQCSSLLCSAFILLPIISKQYKLWENKLVTNNSTGGEERYEQKDMISPLNDSFLSIYLKATTVWPSICSD